MEIKVGDKVRIADNVPEMYTQTVFSVHIPMDMEVEKVQDGSAHITPILSGAGGLSFEYIIPIKYLTKVEDEEKNEPKFSIGDYVEDIAHPFPISDCIYQILDLFPTRAQIKSVNGDEPAKTVSLNRLKKIDESVFNPDGIKVGDKARLKSCGIIGNLVARIFICEIVTITAINGGMAAIRLDKDGQTYKMEDVPLRYLEIVEEGENALAEIKVGNMVQICDGSSSLSNGAIVKVVKIKGEYAEVEYKSRCRSTYKLEHLVPYASPSEPKKPSENEGERIRQAEEDLNEKAKEHLFRVLDDFSPQPMDDLILRNSWSVKPKLMFNSEYWLRYEADLAKAVALTAIKRRIHATPDAVGEYAVQVAKSVVKHLKSK